MHDCLCASPSSSLSDLRSTDSAPAGVTALSVFKRKFPDYRADDIARVSKAAISYIRKAQRPDGSWYGSWAVVSFTPTCAGGTLAHSFRFSASPSTSTFSDEAQLVLSYLDYLQCDHVLDRVPRP